MDRLSALPDPILCHILSFLPTKTSIATSILARRWKFLWAYVPKIDFTGRVFADRRITNAHIIARILLLHQLPILTSLRIDTLYENDYDAFEIETWIFAAIHRNVEYLHLAAAYSKLLPSRLFTCKTLVGLRLACGGIPTLYNVCLPCLKKLDLEGVEFEDDESLPCLLSGSPALEYLRIVMCGDDYDEDDEMNSFYVSSPTLKWLCLDGIVGTEGNHRVEINTPALEYLCVRCVYDSSASPIEIGDLISLIRADIFYVRESESLLKLVENLWNVKCLELDLYPYFTAINDGLLSSWNPSLDNLTKLKLTSDYRFLSKFLENASNFEILEFHIRTESNRQSEEGLNEVTKGWMEPEQVPKCLLSCLRTIKIFLHNDNGLEIIAYLLKNAQVLNRMEILSYKSINSNLLQKILLFERESKTCELAFTETGYGTFIKEISPWN